MMPYNMEASASENNLVLDISPYVQPAITDSADLPPLPPELIEGVARKGSKVMLVGGSKIGKTCALLSLATCFATGMEWCGMKCAKGRVLFVNLEVGKEGFAHRQFEVFRRLDANPVMVRENLSICSLRGKVFDIAELAASLLMMPETGEYDVVIIDPAYKVQGGVENNADAIKKFCGALDRLAEGTGCSIVYSHHHPKGYQAWKDASDRASGSGVFARDADAIIDLTELEAKDGEALGIPFRMEFVLRDFGPKAPVNVWFDNPCHRIDLTGALVMRSPRKPGSSANRKRSAQHEKKLADFEAKLDAFMGERDAINRLDFVEQIGCDSRTVNSLLKNSNRFEVVSRSNSAEIRRKVQLADSMQITPQMQGMQGADILKG